MIVVLWSLLRTRAALKSNVLKSDQSLRFLKHSRTEGWATTGLDYGTSELGASPYYGCISNCSFDDRLSNKN